MHKILVTSNVIHEFVDRMNNNKKLFLCHCIIFLCRGQVLVDIVYGVRFILFLLGEHSSNGCIININGYAKCQILVRSS